MTARKSTTKPRAKRRHSAHAQPPIERLLAVMARLRDPDTGCPWDREQNFATIAPYTIEEAYEVAEAAERGAMPELKEELGDLLLQVAFHARMAEEQGAFDFGDVVQAITAKLIRRHPHVFADEDLTTPQDVEGLWERIKAQEKSADKAAAPENALAGVPVAFPALTRALKLQAKASKVGFDWNDPRAVLRKIREETDEIEAELDRAEMDPAATAAEVGDLLFAAVNLARHLKADPEAVLRRTNRKFERRFAAIEQDLAARGKSPQEATLAEMEALWQAAKKIE